MCTEADDLPMVPLGIEARECGFLVISHPRWKM
jgi:hypothetical protein